jgi:hypothetical protein
MINSPGMLDLLVDRKIEAPHELCFPVAELSMEYKLPTQLNRVPRIFGPTNQNIVKARRESQNPSIGITGAVIWLVFSCCKADAIPHDGWRAIEGMGSG